MNSKEYYKKYNQENKEKIKKYKEEYYQKNKDDIKEKSKEYNHKNIEKSKEYYQKNNVNDTNWYKDGEWVWKQKGKEELEKLKMLNKINKEEQIEIDNFTEKLNNCKSEEEIDELLEIELYSLGKYNL